MKRELILGTVILLIFACMVLGVLTYVPSYQIKHSFQEILIVFRTTINVIIVVGGLGISVVFLIGLLWIAWIAYQSGKVWQGLARTRQAEALRLEREAALVVTIAPAGSQVYVSEIAGMLDLVHKPLYLSPGNVGAAGTEFSLEEVKRWSFFQLTQNISKKPEIAVEEVPELQPPLPEHVDLAHYVHGQTSLRSIFLGIGRGRDGQVKPVTAPLKQLVHIAIAGSSGFGKSTCMQALGYQVLNAREQPSTVMLDAQGVTFTPFEGNAGLRFPLASDPNDIKAILHELVVEMGRRKELFGRWRGIDSLEKYNSVISDSQRLPVLPIFFDEFGLLSDDKEIASYVKKLARAGRKFGIYLIAGSQTWYSDEISSSLKANLSTSIQFYAKSKSQSRTLLGDSVAYEITRPGQAFCRLPGHADLIEMQAPDTKNVLEAIPALIEHQPQPMPAKPQPEPTEQEQTILQLFDEGVTRAEIALTVFGSKGGNQYKKIDEILEKFERV